MHFVRWNSLIVSLLVSSVAATQQLTPPNQMKICADNGMCQILTLAGDHYDGVVVGNPNMAAKYQIRHWSADSIDLYGQWMPKGTSMTMMEGPVTGKLAPSGDRVDGAIFDWKMAATRQSGKMMFTFTWDAVSPSAAVAAATSPSVSPVPANVPATGTVLPSGAVIVSGDVARKLVIASPLRANCGLGRAVRSQSTISALLTVSADGTVTDLKNTGPHDMSCDWENTFYAPSWQFKPYTVNGRPTPMAFTISVDVLNGVPSNLQFK